MQAIFKRELKAYFKTAIGFIFLAAYTLLAGIMFLIASIIQNTSNLGGTFSNMMIVYMFLIPILTMKIFSDEKKSKTDQLLLTAPVSLFDIVFGKFLAAFTVFCFAVVEFFFFALVIMMFGKLDFVSFFGNVIGILLLGAAFIAIGVFISCTTESQVIAAVGTFGVMFFLIIVGSFNQIFNNAILTKIISWISIFDRYYLFGQGVFNIADVLYMLSVTAVFLFLTARLLEKRRWS